MTRHDHGCASALPLLVVNKGVASRAHTTAPSHNLLNISLVNESSGLRCLRQSCIPRISVPFTKTLQIERKGHFVNVLPRFLICRRE